MVYEWVAEAEGAKRCCFQLSAVSELVVKDRERCCLLIALIVRRGRVIICKAPTGPRNGRLRFVVSQVPKSEGPGALEKNPPCSTTPL
jgi:hypothetical protein